MRGPVFGQAGDISGSVGGTARLLMSTETPEPVIRPVWGGLLPCLNN